MGTLPQRNCGFFKMSYACPPRVRFANPVVKSVSRKPTRIEYLHINLLESHTERCAACERLLRNQMPSCCRRGEILEDLVLRDFVVRKDGYVYSVCTERGYPVRVELSRDYLAVRALLRQVDGRHIRGYYQ
jgi:hypothetical protein